MERSLQLLSEGYTNLDMDSLSIPREDTSMAIQGSIRLGDKKVRCKLSK